MRLLLLATGLSFAPAWPAAAEDDNVKKAVMLLEQAGAAYEKGKPKEAISLADKAAALDPKNPAAYYLLGDAHRSLRQNDDAARNFRKVIELNPKFTPAYDKLGDALLKTGHFPEAVAAFDEYLKARPQDAPQHWRRGIALYYAGKFAEGKKQFELHRTVNPEDVENSAWHYLCNARATSPKQARAELIPVTKDPRVPMKQVLELFAGKLKPQDVLDAAEQAKLKDEDRKDARFYANLYVGLYYESEGDSQKALEHLTDAVEKYKIGDYMWDVADAHLKQLKAKKP
jgi:lipoprotein NlpI